MSLPKIATPEYTVKLWTITTPVRFRPYLVKEEKLLLTAKQAGDNESIERAMVQILTNCTFGALDIAALPSFDLEYLFLQIRSKSVSELAKLQYECQNIVRDEAGRTATDDDGRCHNVVTVSVDLSKIELHASTPSSPVITLRDGTKLELQYLTLKRLSTTSDAHNPIAIAASAIKTITDTAGTMYEAHDHTETELIEFVESMHIDDLAQFETFIASMPKLKHKTEFVCNKCGYREMITFEGLSAFFT